MAKPDTPDDRWPKSFVRNVTNDGGWELGHTVSFEFMDSSDERNPGHFHAVVSSNDGDGGDVLYPEGYVATEELIGAKVIDRPDVTGDAIPCGPSPDNWPPSNLSVKNSDMRYPRGESQWIRVVLEIPLVFPVGRYDILIEEVSNFRYVDFQVLEVTIFAVGGSPSSTFPSTRPSTYDPDEVWQPPVLPSFPTFEEIPPSEDDEAEFPEFPDLPDLPVNEEPETGSYVAITELATLGGGRYNEQLVVIGHEKIYFGDFV